MTTPPADNGWTFPVATSSRNVFMVLYATPNTGKTILASRIAKLYGKALILTEESGHLALLDFPELAENTQVRNFETPNDIYQAFKLRQQGKLEFDTMILDTYSGIVSKTMRFYMTPKLSNGSDNPAYLETKRNHPDIPALKDYLMAVQTWAPVMQFLATQKEKLNVNVILNCHLQNPDPEKPKIGDITRPKLPGGVWELANGKANVVAFLRTGEPNKDGEYQRFVRAHKTTKLAGKTQIKMPLEISDDEFVRRIDEWRTRSL